MRVILVSLAGLMLFFSACSDQSNPLGSGASLYAFYQKWGKDYSNPDNSIGPGHGDGTSGSETGAYNTPMRLALSSGCLLVLDSGNYRIQKFGLNGSVSPFSDQSKADYNALGSKGAVAGKFSKPSDLKTDSAGNIFVPDANNFNVQIFSSAGSFLQRIAVTNTGTGLPVGTNIPGGFMKPVAVCADNSGGLYILDPVKDTIDKYTNSSPNSWTLSAGWGTSGSLGNALFSRGLALEFDMNRLVVLVPEGFVLVDLTSQTVTGKTIFGYSLNRLSRASGLKIINGSFYVTEGSYIKIFNGTFGLTSYLGGISGSKDGEFLSPLDVLLSENILYAADSGNNRIQLFKAP